MNAAIDCGPAIHAYMRLPGSRAWPSLRFVGFYDGDDGAYEMRKEENPMKVARWISNGCCLEYTPLPDTKPRPMEWITKERAR